MGLQGDGGRLSHTREKSIQRNKLSVKNRSGVIDMEHNSEIILYQTPDGQIKIDVLLEDETVWLTQNQLSALFQTDRTSIVKHIKNIYESGELSETATCAKIAQVQQEGKRKVTRNIIYYNLDLIISVGYRVQSHVATHFRIWATQRLREYIVKGFALDDERMKAAGQIRYFDELTERIRDIRSSERIFYQKVKDIFCLSIDYDARTKQARDFFATLQNNYIPAIKESLYAKKNRIYSQRMTLYNPYLSQYVHLQPIYRV